MPTLARPEVDVLDGLTTAIIVDQERMGANARSTVGTATDANAMLRVLFSRLGQPHIGSSNAFSFNVPSVRGAGAITMERGAGKTVKRTFSSTGGMCPRCEGRGTVSDIDLTQLFDDSKSLAEGAITIPGYKTDSWWTTGVFIEFGLPRPEQAHPQVHQERAPGLPLQGAGQGEGQRRQPHVRGADPQAAEVDALQGPRRAAAAHSGVRGSGSHLQGLPRLWRHPAQRRRPLLENRRHQHRRRLRDADQRPRRMGPWHQRAVGGAVARHAAADPRVVRGDRTRLPLARATGGHAVGRRGATGEDGSPPRLLAHRRHLRLRRAHHGHASARHPANEQPAAAAAGQGQHGAGRGARTGDDRDRRPCRGPRARRRRCGRHRLLRGHGDGPARQ